MEVTKCDRCRCKGARSFRYEANKNIKNCGPVWKYTDLCLNCMQDFVREQNIRLEEVVASPKSKKLILG